MVKGFFLGNVPFIEIAIAYRDIVKRDIFVIDTGFSGELQLNAKIAEQLGVRGEAVELIKYGNGTMEKTAYSVTRAALEFRDFRVKTFISEGASLAGIGFLKKFGYRLCICCRQHTVELELTEDR